MSSYRPQARDTSEAADRMQFELWRRMSPQERVELFRSFNDSVQEMALIGIRHRHPHASEREIFLRLAATRLDRDTMIRVYGWDPEENRR